MVVKLPMDRWLTLVENGMVIPTEDLPMDPVIFQQRCSNAIYQIAKEVYQISNDLKELKKKRKTKKKNVEEVSPLTIVENPFGLLESDE